METVSNLTIFIQRVCIYFFYFLQLRFTYLVSIAMETRKFNSFLKNIYTYYLRYNDEIRWDNAKWSGSYATTVKRIRYLYVNLIVMIICALIWEFAKVSLLRHLGYIIKKF